jgi:hypothetical protein
MKKLIVFVLLGALPSQLTGRLTKDWTFQEMFAKSDVVVIAGPIATSETTEHTTLADLSPPVAVLGLNTEFRARLVLKGDKEMTKFVLHHYKLEHEEPMINAPQLIAFDSKASPKRFLLFLVRESDGRYAPVTGQTDPALYSVIQLQTDAE